MIIFLKRQWEGENNMIHLLEKKSVQTKKHHGKTNHSKDTSATKSLGFKIISVLVIGYITTKIKNRKKN